jgi:hypothetical protein
MKQDKIVARISRRNHRRLQERCAVLYARSLERWATR